MSKLEIISATFGVADKTVDVTEVVRKRVSNNGLVLPVETFILGVDPAPGASKTLTLRYKIGTTERTESFAERRIVDLNGGMSRESKEFLLKELESECADSLIVSSIKMLLGGLDEESLLTPVEKRQLREALESYIKDCSLCKREAYNDYRCQQVAMTKLLRNFPYSRGLIYPQRNYDWSYSNYIDNNYSVMATGATKSGSLGGLVKNLEAMIKLLNGFLFDANPASNSVAGGRSRNDDYPFYECTTGIRDPNGNIITSATEARVCRVIEQIKRGDPETPPADSDFLRSQPISGQWSSSFYVKSGTCPRPDIVTRTDCEGKNFEWLPSSMNAEEQETQGSCYQPRYAFIDNRSRGPRVAGRSLDGIVPSIANDFLSITPEKVLAAMTGKSIAGQLIVEQCPQVSAPSKLVRVDTFIDMPQPTHYAFVLSVAVVLMGFLILLRSK
jgi:hypothetical protein